MTGDKRRLINEGIASFLSDPDPRAHIYLGADDKEAPFDLLPDSFPESGLMVIEEGTHTTIFRNDSVRDDVERRVCGL